MPKRLLKFIACLTPALPLVVVGVLCWSRAGTDLIRWPGLERIAIGRMIAKNEDSYLHALRDTHLGCLSLQYRPADVIMIGDSHNYAGYDYKLLQDRLKPLVVGNCALSGMFPQNVIQFLDATRFAGLLPRDLIFGISPEMFWDDADRRADRTARASREIARINQSKESLAGVLKGQLKTIPEFRVDSAAERSLHMKGLETLSEPVLESFFARYTKGVNALDYWKKTVASSKADENALPVIERICEAARRSSVRLGVVYIPESRWLIQQLSNAQREAFGRVMERFRACADWTFFDFFDEGGGPNLWYVNRYAIPDYPYDAWYDPAAAVSWESQSPTARRWQLFDPDHMNTLGATKFSEALLSRIAEWRRP